MKYMDYARPRLMSSSTAQCPSQAIGLPALYYDRVTKLRKKSTYENTTPWQPVKQSNEE